MCFILFLSASQQDNAARAFSHCMLLNIIVTQLVKRLYVRQRPGDHQPPRALQIIPQNGSGFPSAVLIQATTFIYVAFASDCWYKGLSNINKVNNWVAPFIAIAVFLVMSFAKVHLGQNYPSDCVISTVPILLIIILFYFTWWIDSLALFCPACG